MFFKVLGNGVDAFMIFSESAEHVVDVAIRDIIFRFEVVFELIDGHVFGCVLHDLENFCHIVLMFSFFGEVNVIMGVIEEDKSVLFV